jgi:hypothetical protein
MNTLKALSQISKAAIVLPQACAADVLSFVAGAVDSAVARGRVQGLRKREATPKSGFSKIGVSQGLLRNPTSAPLARFGFPRSPRFEGR